jgi:hypothetical protein
MSEDRIDQGEAKDDDVEAHRRRHLTDELREADSDDSDDVEAHRRRALTDELKETDDDNESDDFELHRRRA